MNRYTDMGAWSGGYGGKRASTTMLRVPIRKADERTVKTSAGVTLTAQQIANLLRNRGAK